MMPETLLTLLALGVLVCSIILVWNAIR